MRTGVTVRIGTRGSLLARAQTDWMVREFNELDPALKVEVIVIRTTGDAVTDRPLSRVGGTGLFTKEIQAALLAGRVDCAVHSLKDLPTEQPDGLEIGAIPAREDPRDALVGLTPEQILRSDRRLKIGTSSLRRAAQLRRSFPGADVVDLRGNVDTRLRKVREGNVDCAVLAAAGLRRLGLEREISAALEPDEMLPAPAQGALGIEIRRGDEKLRDLLSSLHCSVTERCVSAERAVLSALGGGCQVPVGALGRIDNNQLHLQARVISIDGRRMVQAARSGASDAAEGLGRRLADDLLEKGAGPIIEETLREARRGADNG